MSEQQKIRKYTRAFRLICGRPPKDFNELAQFLAMIVRWDFDIRRLEAQK